jgi:hypothetical protein
MINLKESIMGELKEGEHVLAVVIQGEKEEKLLTWTEALPILDHDFTTEYVDCPAIYAWSETRIFFISQYDGSTKLETIPRNPTAGTPTMPGA